MDVETSGKGFNSAGWVEFLFEPHKFYANVTKNKLQEAVNEGLAYPHWKGPGSYPKTLQLRIDQFKKAAALDETAAIASASWGLGQIMGSECKEVGYDTPQAMLTAFAESEENQVIGMLRLIKNRGLDKDLLRFPNLDACRHFALRYNGAGYERNMYHIKLQTAFIRESHAQQDTPVVEEGTIVYGTRDTSPNGPVHTLQKALIKVGAVINQDGDFGPRTKAAVLVWKAKNGLGTSPDVSQQDLAKLKGEMT
jgi:hypothetical protein